MSIFLSMGNELTEFGLENNNDVIAGKNSN